MSDIGDDWALYAGHRARFSAELSACAPVNGWRLCILGAGKCNDVDLERLAEVFSEIHLVDIDPPAVASAVARQSAEVRARLRLHVPVDLAGLTAKRLGKWQRKPPTRAELEQLETSTLAAVVARLPGPFDVVASACILTQLSFAVRQALGERSPALSAVRFSVMLTHLRSLLALTRVGGTSLFASDVVSSSTHPLLSELPADADLGGVLNEVSAAGNVYFAANPKLIRDALTYDAVMAEQVGALTQLPPWLWSGPLGRIYLVYGLRLARA